MMAAFAGLTKFANYAKLWERRQIEANRGVWTAQDRALLDDHDAPA